MGRAAALQEKADGPAHRLVTLTLDADGADALGDEPVLLEGRTVGWVTSGGYGHFAAASIALAYVEAGCAAQDAPFQVEVLGAMRPARLAPRPLFRSGWHGDARLGRDVESQLPGPPPRAGAIRARLRRAAPADAAAVRALTRAAYAKWVGLIGREPRPMTADYEAAVRDHLVDLLIQDAEPVALIEMRLEADHLLIINVAVLPSCQGRGYGRALLAHAEDCARAAGRNEIRLYTNGSFTENVRLYERVGYRVDREETSPQLGVAVYMSKRL